jgi:hypothetical protein
VLLFRYSALTFNGHRIHYDRRYVTEVEGYPGLIVHGPLIATMLVDLLRRNMAGAHIGTIAMRCATSAPSSGRVLPQDRREARLPRGLRRRADQGRLAGGADPAGVRRLGPRPHRGLGDHGRDQPLRRQPAPATARCTTWARCCARLGGAEARYLPKIATGELRLQSMGVTEPTTGTDTTKIKTTAVKQGRPLRGQRPEGLDLAHPAFRPDDPAGAHHAAGRGEEEVRRHVDLHRRPARGHRQGADGAADPNMVNHETNELFFDNLEIPAENLIGEEGKGFKYILDG